MANECNAELLQKLKTLTSDQIRAAGLGHLDFMKIITLLENDSLPLDAKERGGYHLVRSPAATPEVSVTGPGLLYHDTPVFQSEYEARKMCRCLSRAFAAGQRNRSAALLELLGDAQHR